jgi:hypothetical protein
MRLMTLYLTLPPEKLLLTEPTLLRNL